MAVDPAQGRDLVVAEVDIVVELRTNEDGRDDDPKAIIDKLPVHSQRINYQRGFLLRRALAEPLDQHEHCDCLLVVEPRVDGHGHEVGQHANRRPGFGVEWRIVRRV